MFPQRTRKVALYFKHISYREKENKRVRERKRETDREASISRHSFLAIKKIQDFTKRKYIQCSPNGAAANY